MSELESTLIEIFDHKKTNIIIGYICKHSILNVNEFNDDYVNELLDELSKENRTIFLLCNLNIYLLKFDPHPATNEFLNLFLSHFLFPIS